MGEFKTWWIRLRSLYGENKTGRIQSCLQYLTSCTATLVAHTWVTFGSPHRYDNKQTITTRTSFLLRYFFTYGEKWSLIVVTITSVDANCKYSWNIYISSSIMILLNTSYSRGLNFCVNLRVCGDAKMKFSTIISIERMKEQDIANLENKVSWIYLGWWPRENIGHVNNKYVFYRIY